MNQTNYTRRNVSKSLLSRLVALLLAALLGVASAQSYNEAPALAAQVEAGELPPVAERLPTEPMVLPVVERIGEYGGTWDSASVGGLDLGWFIRTMGYENLFRWNHEWTEVIPNVVESYSVNDDATEYTFNLREGMRWSDGEPFTSEDIMFWYEDIFLNADLNPGQSGELFGVPLEEVRAPDDTTVVFRFGAPFGLFLENLAHPNSAYFVQYPEHHMKQFHPNYDPENVERILAEGEFADWPSLFQSKGGLTGRWENLELPSLNPWLMVEMSDTRAVAERNPYYWKVDAEGNQLPYIDRLVFPVVDNAEIAVLRALNGEIDMMDRHIAQLGNKAVFADNMERGDYQFFRKVPGIMNTSVMAFNLTHNDPVLREIFQNKDFRAAMSHAINRQEIIDLIYVGQGEPWQAAPRPESPFHHEELAKQYTEYDPELANELLDRHFPERDASGFRLGPDGERISFIIEYADSYHPEWSDIMELIVRYWQDVGIDAQARVLDRELFVTRRSANEQDVSVWQGDSGMFDAVLNPRDYLPTSASSAFAILWGRWYEGAEGGEEPPADVKAHLELYDRVRTSVGEEQQVLMDELLDESAEQFYNIGLVLPGELYGIVKNDFHNVPEVMFQSWTYPEPAATNPEQYFISPSDQ